MVRLPAKKATRSSSSVSYSSCARMALTLLTTSFASPQRTEPTNRFESCGQGSPPPNVKVKMGSLQLLLPMQRSSTVEMENG